MEAVLETGSSKQAAKNLVEGFRVVLAAGMWDGGRCSIQPADGGDLRRCVLDRVPAQLLLHLERGVYRLRRSEEIPSGRGNGPNASDHPGQSVQRGRLVRGLARYRARAGGIRRDLRDHQHDADELHGGLLASGDNRSHGETANCLSFELGSESQNAGPDLLLSPRETVHIVFPQSFVLPARHGENSCLVMAGMPPPIQLHGGRLSALRNVRRYGPRSEVAVCADSIAVMAHRQERDTAATQRCRAATGILSTMLGPCRMCSPSRHAPPVGQTGRWTHGLEVRGADFAVTRHRRRAHHEHRLKHLVQRSGAGSTLDLPEQLTNGSLRHRLDILCDGRETHDAG